VGNKGSNMMRWRTTRCDGDECQGCSGLTAGLSLRQCGWRAEAYSRHRIKFMRKDGCFNIVLASGSRLIYWVTHSWNASIKEVLRTGLSLTLEDGKRQIGVIFRIIVFIDFKREITHLTRPSGWKSIQDLPLDSQTYEVCGGSYACFHGLLWGFL